MGRYPFARCTRHSAESLQTVGVSPHFIPPGINNTVQIPLETGAVFTQEHVSGEQFKATMVLFQHSCIHHKFLK